MKGLYDDVGLLGLSMPLPNPAPDIDLAPPVPPVLPAAASAPPAAPPSMAPPAAGPDGVQFDIEDPDEPKKKKYAKEAWPGKKPMPSLLV